MSKVISQNRYVLSMNTHGQITIPATIRKKWHLDSSTLIISHFNVEGQLVVFPAIAVPKGLSLTGNPKLQKDLKEIYKKKYSGSEFSASKLNDETEKD
jgi:bifunctional DNA-binding transcriptional regulator/antitoxin component of YhaV-PrlF toxin-antitoxin module